MALRMEHALHLLENSRISIKEIACHIGFNTTGYFIRAFTSRYGVTPGAFRNHLHSGGTANVTKVH
ncbi:MAG: helix-turn-helix transcriptional regulator, partial [Victivallaceae bacterium]